MYAIQKISSEYFPEGLLEIPEPPDSLSVAGALPPKEAVFLAVVGSRRHTEYGRAVCEKIINGLRGSGIVIVSGLALGIDAIAHRSALKENLQTVAFPGSGISPEALYPRAHLPLAREIIKKGGALLSEFPDNFKATPYSFPQRNRLMAGMARGILVIEAEEKSGTLITARLGLDYNRDVFAVPGSIFSRGSTGTNRLIKEGAMPVVSGEDILKHWNMEKESEPAVPEDVTDAEARVLAVLREPMPKDDIMAESEMSATELNVALATLELKGLIRESLGKVQRT